MVNFIHKKFRWQKKRKLASKLLVLGCSKNNFIFSQQWACLFVFIINLKKCFTSSSNRSFKFKVKCSHKYFPAAYSITLRPFLGGGGTKLVSDQPNMCSIIDKTIMQCQIILYNNVK